MSTFEDSEIYQKALAEYQDKIYGEILKPLNSIIIDNDEVYLFYDQKIVKDIFKRMCDIYSGDEYEEFPIGLGYQEPHIVDIEFMGIKYKAIFLWYDNEGVPDEFLAKIKKI